jgi:hypothetical protein
VTVDSNHREGVTPLVVPGLWLGEPHQLTVELEGYLTHHDVIEFAESSTLTVRVDLALVSPAYLTMRCTPTPCEAWIDEQVVGVTPVERVEVAALEPHEVSLRRGDAVVTTETLTLQPGETRTLQHRGERATPRGEASSRPAVAAAAPAAPEPGEPPEMSAPAPSEAPPPSEPQAAAAEPEPPPPASAPRIQGIMERYLGASEMRRRATMGSP